MLSEQTIQVIKSTAPVLEIHGESITRRFYERLFSHHPELLNVFNHANQQQGRQQTALANAVYAAALHIDRLETILPAVKHIAQKHRSLGVLPEHYPVVGHHLLAAIREVLGEAATPEILAAWEEAYGLIAQTFIGVEAKMYAEAQEQEGGWAGFRTLRVMRKVQESRLITSFYLVPADGGALAGFEPGQYLTLRLEIPGDEHTHLRQYSLSDAPGLPYYRISVKREEAAPGRPAGRVSTFLHEQIQEGSLLQASAPAGEFTLNRAGRGPVVLISGGVGLTPMVSMLAVLAAEQPERQVTFIHAAQNGELHALREQVTELAARHPQISAYWCYSSPTDRDREQQAFHREGVIDLPWLKSIVPSPDADFYFCGPVPFMQAVNRALTQWGAAAERIHYEFFGPSGDLGGAENEVEVG